jgi:hypothetical protein
MKNRERALSIWNWRDSYFKMSPLVWSNNFMLASNQSRRRTRSFSLDKVPQNKYVAALSSFLLFFSLLSDRIWTSLRVGGGRTKYWWIGKLRRIFAINLTSLFRLLRKWAMIIVFWCEKGEEVVITDRKLEKKFVSRLDALSYLSGPLNYYS